MDAVQQANSGHPGTPMALAPLADVLCTRVMKYDAADPDWPDRDRFVLSAGHASMLAVLDAVPVRLRPRARATSREFRQWGSKTPGHPEIGPHEGRRGHDRSARPGHRQRGRHRDRREAPARPVRRRAVRPPHRSAICSDGDFMEGISHEAASFAGHYQLGTPRRSSTTTTTSRSTARPSSTYTDDVPERFRGVRLARVQLGEVAEDLDALEARAARGHGRRGPADAARAALAHRLPVAEVPGHVEGARRTRSVPTRWRGSRRSSACRPTRTSTSPTTCSRYYRAAGRGARRTREWERRARKSRPRTRAGRRVRPRASRAAASRAGSRSCRRGRPGDVARDTRRDRKRCSSAVCRRRARSDRRRRATSPATPACS